MPVGTSFDDGAPPKMVQRVMGHERSSTTLDLYTRRTEDISRILRARSTTRTRTRERPVPGCRRDATPLKPSRMSVVAWIKLLHRPFGWAPSSGVVVDKPPQALN